MEKTINPALKKEEKKRRKKMGRPTNKALATIARQARKHNLDPNTVFQRLNRGASMEKALLPVGDFMKHEKKRPDAELKLIMDFILNFKRENLVPPSIKQITEGLGFGSIGKVRNLMDFLKQEGHIVTDARHKLLVSGERLLLSEENAALNTLLELCQAQPDERMSALAKLLAGGLTNDPDAVGVYAPWLKPIEEISLDRLSEILEELNDNEGQRLLGIVRKTKDDKRTQAMGDLLAHLRSSDDRRIKNLVAFLAEEYAPE